MKRFSFSLLAGETNALIMANAPSRLRIPIHGHTPILSEGDQALGGDTLARANAPGDGDVHAPLSGVVKRVDEFSLTMDVAGDDRAEPQGPPADGGDRLKEWLRQMGVNVGALTKAATLIVNGVPPEPGITVFEPLLRDYRKTVELGLETVAKIVVPSKMFLVTAKGNLANAFPNCTVTHVPPVYPNGVEQLVVKAVTGQETLLGQSPDNASIVTVRDLFYIGRIMETGRPLTEAVMTIAGENYAVKVGTPVGFLVEEAGLSAGRGDKVVLGGLMRGMAALNLEQGVGKYATGLNVLGFKEGFVPTNNFCLGCGECERRCPARIMPGMISRCAEFKRFERAEDYHIHSCFECGICSYWCTAERPLLQYIRYAKYELALLRTATGNLEGTPGADAQQEDQAQ